MYSPKRLTAFLLSLSLLSGLSAAVMAAEAPAFTDVPTNAWYARAAEYINGRGLMNGVGQDRFDPNGPVSRGMLAIILYRMVGSPASGGQPFTDVAPEAWYADAASWAGWSGVISGYGNDAFAGEDPVTREQLVTILWRYMGCPDAQPGALFDDEWTISPFADSAVDWAQATGVVTGRDHNLFVPKGTTTRAELAVILQRLIGLTDPTALATHTPEPTPEPEPTPQETPEVSPEPEKAPSESGELLETPEPTGT